MIFEAAILTVREGQQSEFEAAMRLAKPLIEASPGFVSIAVRRSVESPNQYLLLVQWKTVGDHTLGFRQSERYRRWSSLLHHFYDPFPSVEHYGEDLFD